jgi:hypothetical protein
MIRYVSINDLLYSKKEGVMSGRMSIYDLKLKDVSHYYRLYLKECILDGDSVVFKHNNRSKILIYNN